MSSIENIIKNLNPFQPSSNKDLGRKTELKCICGGFLHESNVHDKMTAKLIGPKPKHKKKRILKKKMKQWRLKALPYLMISPLSKPSFVCGSCFKREGFYGAIGKNIIQVQPMPPGALLVYDKAPDEFHE